MADKVKVLVVGLGNMGASHASAYHRNPGFEIVGLMSRSMKSKQVPDELKGYPLFEDYDEALRVAALTAGVDRVVAKPFRLEEMIEAVRAVGEG